MLFAYTKNNMKTLSIAAIQLSLSRKGNYALVESKAREAVFRFPWLQMLVFSELAGGGAGAKNSSFFLSEYSVKLKELAKELDIWLIPGSFYEKTENGTFNTAPVITIKVSLLPNVGNCIHSFHMRVELKLEVKYVFLKYPAQGK